MSSGAKASTRWTDWAEQALFFVLYPIMRWTEKTSTQRNRYFSDFRLALKYDAIEAGIKSLAVALYQAGAAPQFSCEGHHTHKSILPRICSWPYILFWVPPALDAAFQANVLRAIEEAPHYLWHLSRKSSLPECQIASAFNGQEGFYYHLTCTLFERERLPAHKARLDAAKVRADTEAMARVFA